MNARQKPEDSSVEEPSDERVFGKRVPNLLEAILSTRSARNRASAMGARGFEASTIGWVLVGCIAFGFVVGNLADRHFGTAIWMPLGVMVGIAAGFREMFVTLNALSKRDKAERGAKRKAADNVTPTAQSSFKPRGADYQAPAPQVTPVERERIFKVPPPPTASFEAAGKSAAQSTLKSNEKLSANELSDSDTEKLIEKLLKEPTDDEEIRRDQA